MSMRNQVYRPILAGIAFLRQHLTRRKIRREERIFSSSSARYIGETKKLEILPLYEAAALNGLQSGAGVSYLIRTDKANILFDLGNNPTAASPSPLEFNMARLGIALDEIDLLVISHRHPDHIGGIKWWRKRSFSLNGESQPVLASLPVYASEKITYPGSCLTLTQRPTRLAEGVMTTGLFTFFEPYHVPWVMPRDNEQALAVNVVGQGIVLITGCGHMGLRALLDRAEALFDAPVIGVVGGLHYTNAGADSLQAEIQWLQERCLKIIALSPHDSGPAALAAFVRAFPKSYRSIRAGETIQIA
jgi:7,8-dihydropterin-6-yl-methyl-4-(beta-D-ribofuranosyl)aminobenzene 5'-phosphate synthase